MKKQVKKTHKASKTRMKLKNNTGRPYPLTAKSGPTINRSRAKLGGIYDK